jgi:phosphoglucosamine mutase
MNTNPDGRNINLGCGSLHPEVVAAKVIEIGAALGIA